MAKIRREEIVLAALEVLDEVGLDALSTRRLARRLGVESPALYWHFRDKAALLNAMSAQVVATLHQTPIPEDTNMWSQWFAENARTFRKTLLAFRDGARLHAGSKPDERELERVKPKIQYLVRAGIPRHDAIMAIVTASQFTLGCVLEEQARQHQSATGETDLQVRTDKSTLGRAVERVAANPNTNFEFGLELLISGLTHRFR